VRKRIFITLCSSVAVALLLPAISYAGTINEISGVVTSNGNIAVGAQVVVVCNSNTKKTTTNTTGTYLVQYTAAQCPNEALAQVTATYKGQSGNNSGEVKGGNLILAEKPNTAGVPRASLITGAAATVLGGVGYISLRRR
jgi:hypothetical protein